MSATPLLDREQPLPTLRRASYWYSAVLGAALGVVLIFGADDSEDWTSPTLWSVKILAAFYFGVLWHELGHLVAGVAAGFELRNLAVGGFLIEKQKQGWRLRFLPRRWL